jgi:hypothetical protein
MGKTIHERDAKVTAFKPAPLSPVACGIDPSCLQNSLKSRRGSRSAGVPARDILRTYAFACTIRSRRVCMFPMYNIGALRKFIHVYQFPHIAVMRHSRFAIPESDHSRSEYGRCILIPNSSMLPYLIPYNGIRTTGLAWNDDRCTVLDYILHDYNYAEPCGTVQGTMYSRLVFNRQYTGQYGKSLWRRGI